MRYRNILLGSRVNGPGVRNVLFVQGCSLRCPGCCNQELWPAQGGKQAPPEQLAEWLLGSASDGITISGGEPLQQPGDLRKLLLLLSGKSILLFTGYTKSEILSSRDLTEILSLCDAVVTGRFIAEQRCYRGLRGSGNQEILLMTPRYTLRDLEEYEQGVEIHSEPPVITGFPVEE